MAISNCKPKEFHTQLFEQQMEQNTQYGKVILVGAGPGDPDLLTIKGRDQIAQADVILYDALISQEILKHSKPDCKKVFVGKRSGHHSAKQEEINEMLLQYAKEYKHVVRLKGGDPFVFGRGGEEAMFLAAHGVQFEIVPGVTSGVAVPAYAGIPITHRGAATSVTFVTGHVSSASSPKRNWQALAKLNGTLVFFMGVHNLEEITTQLIKHGRAEDTPAAIIRNGSLPDQEILTATLSTLTQEAQNHNFAPPALIIIGEVVNFSAALSWFEG